MNSGILKLIKVVNDGYNHIEQLETLCSILDYKEEYKNELIVAKTTYNSHYDYNLFGHKAYQYPENHVNHFVSKQGSWLHVQDGYIVSDITEDHKISYPREDGRSIDIMKRHRDLKL